MWKNNNNSRLIQVFIKFFFDDEFQACLCLLSSLDVEVIREQGKFTTTVYREPTFSGVYSNFESFLPSVYKFGMVYTLVYRCFRISSNWTQFHTELTFLKGIFRKNGYPENFIDKCFKKFLNNVHLVKENVPTVEKKRLLLVLPYLGIILELNYNKH